MTNPSFCEEWRIISSTSRFFPVHSIVRLVKRKQGRGRIDLAVEWEGGLSLVLLEDKAFPDDVPGTFEGSFGHHTQSKGEEQFELSVTVCHGPKKRKKKMFLCGVLLPLLAGIDPGATGVWVAEEDRPKRPPGKHT